MKTYYHLSEDGGLEVISSSSFVRAPGICLPRIPEDCPGEDQRTRRVCVAPSVWQCVLSIGRKCKLFIYQVRTSSVTNPIVIPGKISDFDPMGEKWITDDDIQKCGGQIALRPLGFIKYTDEVEWAIRKVVGRPVSAIAGSDSSFFVDRDGEWLLKVS